MSLSLFSFKKKPAPEMPIDGIKPVPTPFEPAELPVLNSDPLKRLLEQQRLGYVVHQAAAFADHPQIESLFQAAVEAIDERFALVPEGFVTLPGTVNDYPGCPEQDIDTQAFLLARHCITNLQYQFFVDDGGYSNLDLWPEDILPHLVDFLDVTGSPGPRFWRQGRHDKRMEDHPVIGICYYEAAAYAAWAGYRLPINAEWQMAASWRIHSAANTLRRYPWGDAMDTDKCNIWASRVGHTVPVASYEHGAAPNAVLQLIGNVWEWTESDLMIEDDNARQVVGDMLLKEIRGGAFDTYFPTQATSVFRTGLPALARTHNVGMRCVATLEDDQRQPSNPTEPPAMET